jgi:hypothetical protein
MKMMTHFACFERKAIVEMQHDCLIVMGRGGNAKTAGGRLFMPVILGAGHGDTSCSFCSQRYLIAKSPFPLRCWIRGWLASISCLCLASRLCTGWALSSVTSS